MSNIKRKYNQLQTNVFRDSIHIRFLFIKPTKCIGEIRLRLYSRICAYFPAVKLVRGAYWNQDKLTGALFLKKSDTDTAFRDAMILALANSQHHTMVCTHNTKDIHFLIDSRVAKQHIVHASFYQNLLLFARILKPINIFPTEKWRTPFRIYSDAFLKTPIF